MTTLCKLAAHTKKLSCISTTAFLLASASIIVNADDSQKNILPYIQPDGKFSTASQPKVVWLTNEKIIYSQPLVDLDSAREVQSDKVIFYDDKAFQVVTFDISTQKTEFYKKGLLLELDEGIATISISAVKGNPVDSYSELLKGPLGQEVPETYYELQHPKPQQCPNDGTSPLTSSPGTYVAWSSIPLKAKHGCIRGLTPKTSPRTEQYTYFLADSKQIELPVATDDTLRWHHWIDWLNAYMFGDSIKVIDSNVRGIRSNKPNIYLLYPTGELKLVDIEKFGYVHLRPTRAGMIAAKNSAAKTLAAPSNGFYLWQDGKKIQITEGNGFDPVIAPDGCKVAYYSGYAGPFSKDEQSRLRIIDVCKGFRISADANPFR